MRWYESIGREQWKALAAAQLGWMLDATDVMLYAFALTSIQAEFGLSSGTAGLLMTVTLVSSSAGGILSGWLSDRYGRVRMLTYSILAYSVFTAMTATASSVGALLVWRTLVGLGLGGEWSAGSVLVAEVFPAEHRGKVIGIMQSGWAIGYIFAALLAATILPAYGWRPLFVVGLFPALLAAWVRRSVPEPEIWKIREERRRRTPPCPLDLPASAGTQHRRGHAARHRGAVRLLGTVQLAAGVSGDPARAWRRGHEPGSIVGLDHSRCRSARSSATLLFGYFSDRFGRRPSFVVFVLAAAALTPLYGLCGRTRWRSWRSVRWSASSGMATSASSGRLLAELFPSAVRGMAQGLVLQRRTSGRRPGAVRDRQAADRYGIGTALTVTSLFFVAAAGLMLMLKETAERNWNDHRSQLRHGRARRHQEDRMMPLVSSANVACGAHAGDPA